MNELKNRMRLISRVGNEPQVKKLGNGRTVVNFSVGTIEYFRDSEGSKKSDITWHRIVAWGLPATVAEKYLKKDAEIAVERKLTNRSWAWKDGDKLNITEVTIYSLLLLGKNSKNTQGTAIKYDLPF
jgi:single-strand DNA-binding protein